MKLTPDIQIRLDKLKNVMILMVKGKSWFNREIEAMTVIGWDVEEIPEKKGIFGHPAYTKLVRINIMSAKYIGTEYKGVFDASEIVMFFLERGRKLWLKMEDDAQKFGFNITKEKH